MNAALLTTWNELEKELRIQRRNSFSNAIMGLASNSPIRSASLSKLRESIMGESSSDPTATALRELPDATLM